MAGRALLVQLLGCHESVERHCKEGVHSRGGVGSLARPDMQLRGLATAGVCQSFTYARAASCHVGCTACPAAGARAWLLARDADSQGVRAAGVCLARPAATLMHGPLPLSWLSWSCSVFLTAPLVTPVAGFFSGRSGPQPAAWAGGLTACNGALFHCRHFHDWTVSAVRHCMMTLSVSLAHDTCAVPVRAVSEQVKAHCQRSCLLCGSGQTTCYESGAFKLCIMAMRASLPHMRVWHA